MLKTINTPAKRLFPERAKTVQRHANNTARTQHTRGSNSVTIQLTTTKALIEVLDHIVETGFFGTSRAAAAERLLSEAVRALLSEGVISKRAKVLGNGK